MASSKDTLIAILVLALAVLSYYNFKNRENNQYSSEQKSQTGVKQEQNAFSRKPVAWIQGQNVSLFFLKSIA